MRNDPVNDPEEELLERFASELKQLSDEPSIELVISPLAAWAIMSQLQLAMRHPENLGPTRVLAEQFTRSLQERVATSGALHEIAQRGWHPEFDVDVD